MEYGRFKQIQDLRSKGWFSDSETERLTKTRNEGVWGGPSFLRSPDGIIHEVGYERVTPANTEIDTSFEQKDSTIQNSDPLDDAIMGLFNNLKDIKHEDD